MVSYATLRGLGAPNKDIDGKDIEDEFSNMPVVQQYVARSWKELVTYRKVNTYIIFISKRDFNLKKKHFITIDDPRTFKG
jgi:hypothetical protein